MPVVVSFGVAACGDDDEATTDTRVDTTDTAQPDTTPAETAAETTPPEDTASETTPEDSTPTDTGTPDTVEPTDVDNPDTAPSPASLACLGTDPTYPSYEPGTLDYDVRLVGYISQAPIAGARARFCARLDPGCEAPVHEAESDADGIMRLVLPAGFDGHVEGEGGGIMPTILMYDPPLIEAPPEVTDLALVTPGELAAVAAIIGATPDPARGHLLGIVLDCDLQPVAGATVEVDFAAGSSMGYTLGGVPSPLAEMTEATGTVGIINLVPGWHTLRATVDGKTYGRGGVWIGAGAISQVRITPMQETPDLSCNGSPERAQGIAGEVEMTVQLRDFVTDAAIVGADVSACASGDFDCTTPLGEATSDESGDAVFTLTATTEGFDGYFQVTGAAIYSTRVYFNPPLLAFGTTPRINVDILTRTVANLFAEISGTTLVPGRAQLAFAVDDCKLADAHGMVVAAENGTTDDSLVVYVAGGLPDPDLTETVTFPSLGGIFNLETGVPVRVTATYAKTGAVIGDYTVTLKPDFLHTIAIVPSIAE